MQSFDAVSSHAALEARYRTGLVRFLFYLGAPFLLGFSIAAPFFGYSYLFSIAYGLCTVIIAGEHFLLRRVTDPQRYLRLYNRLTASFLGILFISHAYLAVLSNQIQHAPWLLVYPSLGILFLGHRTGGIAVALSSVTLLPLFILQGVPVIDEAALRYLRVSTLLVFLLVGAGTLFIEITRRKFMTDLVLQNKRLDASAIHAQSANEAKTRFLANMSHELRTPLNHIIGFTEIVANERVGPLNLEQREYLDDVRTSSQHLLALVEDILDLSKVESGGTRFDPAWVDPVQLVDTTLGRIRVRAESEGVSIENDAREMPDRIWADPTRLTQILDNLLSNAVTYTPNGGQVVMSVRSDAGGDSPRVQFIVSDNGIGIDARDLERIFRPFERAVDPRSDLPGSGLGLALVKRLTELHAGTVHAESAGANMGSKFVVDIPAMPPAAGTEGVATEIET